jgi:hypothetical protein
MNKGQHIYMDNFFSSPNISWIWKMMELVAASHSSQATEDWYASRISANQTMTWGPPVFKQSGNIMGRGRGRRLNWQ